MKRFAFFAIAVVLVGCAHVNTRQPSQMQAKGSLSEIVKEGWHVSAPLTVDAVQARERKKNKAFLRQHADRKDVPAVPFGFQNDEWQQFKKAIKPGDEIRFISSPAKYWQHLAGREGYILVRNGRVILFLVTLEN